MVRVLGGLLDGYVVEPAVAFKDGWPLFPLLRDRSYRLLSGRQRVEAAKELGIEWPEVILEVDSTWQSIAIAMVANIQKPLSAAELRRVEALGDDAIKLLEPDAPGLRPLHRAHLDEIKKGIDDWGLQDLFWFAVYRDPHGRILSGRHRLAAAAELGITWPAVTIGLPEDGGASALRVALVANVHHGWTNGDKKRLAKWGLDRLTLPLKSELIALRLKENHRRSDTRIAADLLFGGETPSPEVVQAVARVRAALEHKGEIGVWRPRKRGQTEQGQPLTEEGQLRQRLRIALLQDTDWGPQRDKDTPSTP